MKVASDEKLAGQDRLQGKWVPVSGYLGVQDLVGVTSNESDWRLFEKTDRADFLSEATLLVPTCHIEGNGTAWFDDLEVIAYDRESLPEDFDEEHGKNNGR